MTNHITLSSGAYTVTLFTTMVEESYSKLLTTIAPPVSSAKWETGPKSTKIVDLLRVTHRFEINGYITATEGSYGSGDSSSTVAGKASDLAALFKKGGVITLTYTAASGTSFLVNIDKLNLKEVPTDSSTALNYDVKMSLIEGVNI